LFLQLSNASGKSSSAGKKSSVINEGNEFRFGVLGLGLVRANVRVRVRVKVRVKVKFKVSV